MVFSLSRKELINYTINVLRTYNIRPRKRLSQNFVIDPRLIRTILSRVRKCKPKRILEIGGGIGTLTFYLSDIAEEVITIEVDKKLIKVLENEIALRKGNVKVVYGDILKAYKKLGSFDVIVSNIPYHISSKILFILTEIKFKEALLTFQKEFADRLLAKPNEPDYGRLTVMANLYFDIEYLGTYSPSSFYPPPKVYSTLIDLRRKRIDVNIPIDFFQDIVRELFTLKNRKLKSAIRNIRFVKNLDDAKFLELIHELEKYVNRRVRTLSIGELIEIASTMYRYYKEI